MFSALKYCTVPGHIFRCPFFEDLVTLITYMSGSYGKSWAKASIMVIEWLSCT